MGPDATGMAVALTIAGSDSGAGAGIQADLRAFDWCGVFGTSVITAVTAQNPLRVSHIHPIPPASIRAQCKAVLSEFSVGAVKTGMLCSADIVTAVVTALRDYRGPVVVDPVMIATSGSGLIRDSAVRALEEMLLPRASLITPNLDEAGRLLGRPVTDALGDAGELAGRYDTAVLLKGGHADDPAQAVDVLFCAAGCWAFTAPRLTPPTSHGSGCSLAAAVAALLARGGDLPTAVRGAKAYVHASLANCRAVGACVHAMTPPAVPAESLVTVTSLPV